MGMMQWWRLLGVVGVVRAEKKPRTRRYGRAYNKASRRGARDRKQERRAVAPRPRENGLQPPRGETTTPSLSLSVLAVIVIFLLDQKKK